jgi:hypothetical protein
MRWCAALFCSAHSSFQAPSAERAIIAAMLGNKKIRKKIFNNNSLLLILGSGAGIATKATGQ